MISRDPRPEDVQALALECAKAAGACREAKRALAAAEEARRVEMKRLSVIVTEAEVDERAAIKRSRELTSLLSRVALCQATVTGSTCQVGDRLTQSILTFKVSGAHVDSNEPQEVRINFGDPVPWETDGAK